MERRQRAQMRVCEACYKADTPSLQITGLLSFHVKGREMRISRPFLIPDRIYRLDLLSIPQKMIEHQVSGPPAT